MIFPHSGLYAITQTENKSDAHIIQAVSDAIKGGAVVIQYRDKRLEKSETLAVELLSICRAKKIPLIINDNVELAQKIGADGVHLGRDDGDILQARALLGEQAIIGISCYNDLEQARTAEKKGANYVAFGRFFASTSKPLAAPAELETLRQAKKIIKVPIVAIGGILPSNGMSLLNAGADVLAVIGGVFSENVEQSACAYQKLFDE